jgi:flagellar biosynthetic protein FliR
MVLSGLFKSFQMVPLAGAEFRGDAALLLIRVFAKMFTIAVQICLPVIAVVLIIDVALGMTGKTAPQMNIFMLGFPIKIIAGIATLATMMPLLGRVFQYLFRMMERDLYTLFKGLT